MLDAAQIDPAKLKSLGEVELRELAATLLTRKARDIDQLLPHRWVPAS